MYVWSVGVCLGDILTPSLSRTVRLLPSLLAGSWSLDWGKPGRMEAGKECRRGLAAASWRGKERVWVSGRLPGMCRGKPGSLTMDLA